MADNIKAEEICWIIKSLMPNKFEDTRDYLSYIVGKLEGTIEVEEPGNSSVGVFSYGKNKGFKIVLPKHTGFLRDNVIIAKCLIHHIIDFSLLGSEQKMFNLYGTSKEHKRAMKIALELLVPSEDFINNLDKDDYILASKYQVPVEYIEQKRSKVAELVV
jgi:hypothetical protein